MQLADYIANNNCVKQFLDLTGEKPEKVP